MKLISRNHTEHWWLNYKDFVWSIRRKGNQSIQWICWPLIDTRRRSCAPRRRTVEPYPSPVIDRTNENQLIREMNVRLRSDKRISPRRSDPSADLWWRRCAADVFAVNRPAFEMARNRRSIKFNSISYTSISFSTFVTRHQSSVLLPFWAIIVKCSDRASSSNELTMGLYFGSATSDNSIPL